MHVPLGFVGLVELFWRVFSGKAEFASSSGHVPKYEHTKSQKTFSKFREVKPPKYLIVNDLRYLKLLSMLGVRDGK